MNTAKKPFVVVITGPTASGKTGLSEHIAKNIPAEIINADVGQFYTKLSVGTAKPDIKNFPSACHLFDIIELPKDLSVAEYRKLVIDKVNRISNLKKTPIIVGGSLFYIKSLFFPPHDINVLSYDIDENSFPEDEKLWDLLNSIDPERAHALHPHDTYRIKRALNIWKKTGIKPSTIQPAFEPPFQALIIFLCPPKDVLWKHIEQRTELMIKKLGWIDEARDLIGTEWEDFVKTKGFIGYSDIIEWIKEGHDEETKQKLIEKIVIKTRQYAKRQITFLHGLEKQIANESKQEHDCWIKVLNLDNVDKTNQKIALNEINQALHLAANQ